MIYPFSSYLYKDETEVVQELLDSLDWSGEVSQSVCAKAATLVEDVRAQKKKGGQLEAFLQEFSLNTEEGLAMMSLAEALLRIPDAATANALIKDKVAATRWLQKQDHGSLLSRAAAFGLKATRATLDSVFSRLGEPVIREAMVQAMQIMGKQFVLGSTIDGAFERGKTWQAQGYGLSYDMLGEGARDAHTAQSYFDAYAHAITFLSANNGQDVHENSSISVKLSALHPRYTYAQKERCVPDITRQLLALCRLAVDSNMRLTVDAEEVARLDISVQIIENILRDPVCENWDGFGLAVQAYQKRALPLIAYLGDVALDLNRHIHMRLVKGAYWDSEIKHAQMHGFVDYPVFTCKRNTDLSYLACAQRMFSYSDCVYPMFATHNAHTLYAVQALAGDKRYEYQRLHGMGEGLYARLMEQNPHVKASIYAPVGPHKDLLPYLVRRLLENGANSSFVNQILDRDVPAQDLVGDPVMRVRAAQLHRHSSIALPADIFGEVRQNSRGYDLDDPESTGDLIAYIDRYILLDINGQNTENDIKNARIRAKSAFKPWSESDVQQRANVLDEVADSFEVNAYELIAILVKEAGKTLPDACDELREAVDFCRYYAARARQDFHEDGILMPGYTGELNRLTLHGRGTFVCISPWNFPLAIFTGQVVAALVAGNCVLAKPASQTPYIAQRAVEIMHAAGVPRDVLHLIIGNGALGGYMVSQVDVAGVAFTGSTATAKIIQKSLAEHNPSIVPFIAETGGQNAMIVDSSALLERVVDDVIHSAFGSAGQRCSALRVLYVQDDIAEAFVKLLAGAMDEVVVGDPSSLSTDVGYIIDAQAKNALDEHVSYILGHGKLIKRVESDEHPRLFAPIAVEIDDISVLKGEVFGPVLHVVRFKASELDRIVDEINATGFGLTFGLQSRIDARHKDLAGRVRAGNIYVNRGMTGAVVGVQPFGGMGLSGTGPKAGGPHYLKAFAQEKLVCTDTTASGGNASLVSLTDD